MIFLKSLKFENARYELNDFFNIGAADDCQLRLSSDLVSARHCRLEKKQSGSYWVKDLRSTTGTYINDVLVQEAQILIGDILKIGEEEFVLAVEKNDENEFPIKSKNPEWNAELKKLGPISKTDFPVLLLGPSGTGKDIIAQEIHQNSFRNQGPFLSVNCSALTETLIESELFGHVKGSFTGAIQDRKGAFEAARGGTLFLDEIGDLHPSLQAKLLRALENQEIRPVGSDKPIKIDVRIIAATHQNLPEKIRSGQFRSDLYFRLNVMSVNPPPLVSRMEDFDTLLYAFAKQCRIRFSFLAIEALKKHSWPGNIRELKNLVARASVIHRGTTVEEFHIPSLLDRTLIEDEDHSEISHNSEIQTEAETLPVIKEIEKQMIIKRLKANQGNQRRTAKDLGMPKSTLHDRLKYYQIDVERFKI